MNSQEMGRDNLVSSEHFGICGGDGRGGGGRIKIYTNSMASCQSQHVLSLFCRLFVALDWFHHMLTIGVPSCGVAAGGSQDLHNHCLLVQPTPHRALCGDPFTHHQSLLTTS